MAWWVQVWYELPLIDRYAHAWMWSHGGWEVRPPSITLQGIKPACGNLAAPYLLACNHVRREQCRKRTSSSTEPSRNVGLGAGFSTSMNRRTLGDPYRV
jgi:hypothetical protein